MATYNASSLVGPVPFKDIKDDSTPTPPQEYNDLISTFPYKKHFSAPWGLMMYKGIWWSEQFLPGVLASREHFTARNSDIFVASFPKSGTTWLKALTFATMTRTNYLFSEHPLLRLNPHDCIPLIEEAFATGQGCKIEALPSPRTLCSHMPYSILPESVTSSGCRIIYICRDPKDTMVSLWHFLNKTWSGEGVPFVNVFDSFCEGKSAFGPIWDHVLGYWRESLTRPDKVLFLKYEEMVEEPARNVKRLAEFVGHPFSEQEEKDGVVEKIIQLCSIKSLKNMEVNKEGNRGMFDFAKASYFRKGEVGDWRNHMTQEMAQRIDWILQEKFQDSGLQCNQQAYQVLPSTSDANE